MISITEGQLMAWLQPLLWPMLRAIALLWALPVFSQRAVPIRLRVALALLIALAAQASLPPVAVVALDSPEAFMRIAQQVLIGASLGFAVRVVFAGVEFAGELVGLQMGLNFAAFFDPLTAAQSTASARFLGTLVAWLFIVINGHLVVLAALIKSFERFPVGPEPFAFIRAAQPQAWGAEIFSLGLAIALPLVGMLLFVNLVLGIVSRVAPQFNVFALGFPVTVGMGLVGMLLTLPLMQMPFTIALEKMLSFFQ